MRLIDAEGSELQTQLKIIREAEYQIYGSGSWGFTTKCEHAIEDAPTIQPEPHWIPVTEQPPKVGKSVLICDAYGDICIGHRTSSGYYFPDFCEDKVKDVRAWCNLPEPYKGVTE